MAEKRMFAKTIIDSDAFLDMPTSAQALYFHLSMRADDEGFINNPKKIVRVVSCSEDDLKLLIAKRFIIPFESGIVVIKHWKIHNYIRKDRLRETVYHREKAQLSTKENNSYTLLPDKCPSDVSQLPDKCQHRLDKNRLDKVRLDEDSIDKPAPKNPAKKKYAEFVSMTKEEYKKLIDKHGEQKTKRMIEVLDNYKGANGKKYKSDYRAILSWVIDRVEKEKPQSSGDPFDVLRALHQEFEGEGYDQTGNS